MGFHAASSPLLHAHIARLLFVVTVLAAAQAAEPTPQAEPYLWRNVPILGGGFVTGLVFSSGQRGLLYARTDVGGAFRWLPSGRWLPLNDNLGREDAEHLGVVSLATDPLDPNNLYLACGGYLPAWADDGIVLWSTDQGRTWGRAKLPIKLGGNTDGRSMGERLQVDPHDNRILFLGSNQDGLWRSADQGRSWARLDRFPATSLTLVLFDARSGGAGQPTPTLYVGVADTKHTAFYRSLDGGAQWTPLPDQPVGLVPNHAALDSTGLLYVTYGNGLGPSDTTAGAVWKFDPARSRWTNITPLAPDPGTKDTFGYGGLALDAQHPGTLMVTTLDRWTSGDEIFRSTDGGITWTALRERSTWDHSAAPYTARLQPHWMGGIAIDPFDSDRALFVTGYGLWGTARATAADTGAPTPWTFAVNSGLEEAVVTGLVSPPLGAPLLSALADCTGFRHDDLTVSPPTGAYEPAYGTNSGLDFAENVPEKIVRTHSGPTRGGYSVDGGRTWKSFAAAPTGAGEGAGRIALSPDGRRIVVLPKGASAFFSTDDGATWSQSHGSPTAPTGFKTMTPVSDRLSSEKFYLYDSETGRVYLSTDGGATFAPSATTLPIAGGLLRAVPGREGEIWVPTPGGLFRSTDAGKKFAKLDHVGAAYQLGFGRAAPGQSHPAIFLFGRVNGSDDGFFRSDDAGRTWVRLNDPAHRFGWINVVAGDPRVFGRVYLGTGGRGIVYGDPAAN